MTAKNDLFRINASGVPKPTGLYDPRNDHDSCGVGFIARIDGVSLHAVVEQGIRILVNLEHRGALGGDKSTGDGAGLLVEVPDTFFRQVCPGDGLYLPARGDYAVGMIFLPFEESLAGRCSGAIEQIAAAEGCPVLGWREVPVDPSFLGDLEEEAGPVAGGFVAPQGAAVLQVDEDPDPLLDNGVQGNAVDPRDEPDAAAVVVVLRVVQAGRFRHAGGVYVKRAALRCHVSRPLRTGGSGRTRYYATRSCRLPTTSCSSCTGTEGGRAPGDVLSYSVPIKRIS